MKAIAEIVSGLFRARELSYSTPPVLAELRIKSTWNQVYVSSVRDAMPSDPTSVIATNSVHVAPRQGALPILSVDELLRFQQTALSTTPTTRYVPHEVTNPLPGETIDSGGIYFGTHYYEHAHKGKPQSVRVKFYPTAELAEFMAEYWERRDKFKVAFDGIVKFDQMTSGFTKEQWDDFRGNPEGFVRRYKQVLDFYTQNTPEQETS